MICVDGDDHLVSLVSRAADSRHTDLIGRPRPLTTHAGRTHAAELLRYRLSGAHHRFETFRALAYLHEFMQSRQAPENHRWKLCLVRVIEKCLEIARDFHHARRCGTDDVDGVLLQKFGKLLLRLLLLLLRLLLVTNLSST